MSRENPRHLRLRIAQLAAQLMLEHGIRDHAQAKRKAARQLGIASANVLPGNEEIDEQIKAHQALFETQPTDQDMQAVYRQALAVMEMLEAFDPILTGTLTQEVIIAHQEIELDIHADSSKEFERFLLNRDIPFKSEERRNGSFFTLYADPADVVVRVLPEQSMHMRRGFDLAQLRRQIAALSPPSAEATDGAGNAIMPPVGADGDM